MDNWDDFYNGHSPALKVSMLYYNISTSNQTQHTNETLQPYTARFIISQYMMAHLPNTNR